MRESCAPARIVRFARCPCTRIAFDRGCVLASALKPSGLCALSRARSADGNLFGDFPDRLHEVGLTVREQSICTALYMGHTAAAKLYDASKMLCTYEDEKDACAGDSGGALTTMCPLVCGWKLMQRRSPHIPIEVHVT